MIRTTTLGALVERRVLYLSDGYRTRASELGVEGVPILRVAEVLDGAIRPISKDRVRDEFRPKFGAKISRQDDVLITTKGTIGRAAMVKVSLPESVYSPQLCFLRVLDRSAIDPHWLYGWVRSPQFQMQAHLVAGQTDMAPYINLADLRNMTIAVPPIRTQRAVAAILRALDDKIEANGRLALICEDLAVAHVESVAETVPLGSLSDAVRDHVAPADFADREVDYYSLPAFDEGRLPLRCRGETIKSGKFRLADPAVLVSKLNPHIPRTWYVSPTPGVVSVASTEFVVLIPRQPWSAGVLWAACAAPSFALSLKTRVRGTTGSHQRVGPEDVLSAPVADLSLVPVAVRNLVEQLVSAAAAARRESVRLQRLRDALLPPLVSGELPVQDAELRFGEVL